MNARPRPLRRATSVTSPLVLALGVLLVLLGLGVLSGKPIARGIAIGVVGVNALAQFADAGSRPMWSIIVIAMDVYIIHALTIYYDPAA